MGIDPTTYPAFQKDRDHAFEQMAPEKRLEDMDACCGRLWASTCDDAVREGTNTEDESQVA
jgi:hypothetical protein